MIPRRLILGRIPNLLPTTTHIRNIAHTSKQPRPQGKHYRLWAVPGDLVMRKNILAKQFTMRWHPGLNAGIDENRSVYALCDGIMVISEEKFDPDWTHPVVSGAYMRGRNKDEKQPPSYMRYINVIPKRRISEFKLVDVV